MIRSVKGNFSIAETSTPPSSNDRIWCIFRQLRSFKDFVNSRISEMPGAPGKTPGESFRSVFSEGPSHFGSSRKFGNSRDGHSRMGVYCIRILNNQWVLLICIHECFVVSSHVSERVWHEVICIHALRSEEEKMKYSHSQSCHLNRSDERDKNRDHLILDASEESTPQDLSAPPLHSMCSTGYHMSQNWCKQSCRF